jgi:hypothetical protein
MLACLMLGQCLAFWYVASITDEMEPRPLTPRPSVFFPSASTEENSASASLARGTDPVQGDDVVRTDEVLLTQEGPNLPRTWARSMVTGSAHGGPDCSQCGGSDPPAYTAGSCRKSLATHSHCLGCICLSHPRSFHQHPLNGKERPQRGLLQAPWLQWPRGSNWRLLSDFSC